MNHYIIETTTAVVWKCNLQHYTTARLSETGLDKMGFK